MRLDLPAPDRPLRIGTRGSLLALAQAREARDRLAQAWSLTEGAFEIVPISTAGDRVTDRPLKELGGKGLFTREIEEGLLAGRIDIAVHSMKDMPTDDPPGLVIDCTLPREDVRDGFVSFAEGGIPDLPPGARVGTSSLRRRAQVLRRRPDLEVVEFRGNVQTRLRKLEEGVAACTFLAMAGLHRLGRSDVPATPIAPSEMLPAVAQGAIGVERRTEDGRVAALLEAIHDRATGLRVGAERGFLAELDGSCQTPIAGLAELSGGTLRLRGEILRTDGSEAIEDAIEGPVEDGPVLGRSLARELLARAGPGFFEHR